MKTTILSPSGLLIAAVGSVTAYALFGRKRSRSSTSKGSGSSKKPLPPPPPPSPFAPGSQCSEIRGGPELDRWVEEVVAPLVLPRIAAYDVPPHEHEQARQAIVEIVDEVFAKSVPECKGFPTSAARLVWKTMWCDVALALSRAGKLDEEEDDLLALCADPSFDPRVPRHEVDWSTIEPPVGPPVPTPQPLPDPPVEPTPPMDASEAGPPPNLWVASSRDELSGLGVMRMMEGTAAGAPIMGPAAHVVMLVFNPVFPQLEQARADMTRLAADNPGVTFVEVSFVDTQRHFGKPSDVNGIMWALAAAGPDGRVLAEPIVRTDPRDPPPSGDEWTKALAHASGFVGLRSVRRIVRPRRFGDLVRSMARAHRRPPPFAPSMPSRKPSRRRSPRRGG